MVVKNLIEDENVTIDNLEGVCNKYREGNIPCYYDNDINPPSCKRITENSDYLDIEWTKIRKKII